MNQPITNYQPKQFYQQKTFQIQSRKPKPRESEPPMMGQQEQDINMQITPDYKPRKPRPSQIGFQAINKTAASKSSTNMNQLFAYDNLKKGNIATKNQNQKYKGDTLYQKKKQITLQNLPKKEEYQVYNSNKIMPTNRFLSPQIKIATNQPERKYSQNFDDINFFKGHKTPSTAISNKPSATKITQDSNNYNNYNISTTQSSNSKPQTQQQKRTPRFSQPGNFTLDMDDEGTGTIYKMNQYNQKTKQSNIKNVKQYSSIQKKINSYINLNEDGNQDSEVGNSAFKKMKQLKQTVSTHSTNYESKKSEIKRESKSPQKKSQLKVSDFIYGKQLGNGKFGSVRIVKHKYTGFVCAMKAIPKAMIIQQNIINQLIRELKIQTYLDHPNIIKLYGFFHDKENIYLLLELGSSGQLYKVIKQRQRLNELSACYVIKQVCQAIRYLHFFKIIHRDLKPQNIVIQSGTIKLCDFGWAVCRGGQLRSTFCGTPLYVSPQILKGQMYDQKIDLWAIGILTYQLLFGNIPFQINTQQQLIKIIKEDIIFPTNIKVSNEAKDFILRILKKNPDQRLKIGQLLQHDFIKKCPQMAIELQ